MYAHMTWIAVGLFVLLTAFFTFRFSRFDRVTKKGTVALKAGKIEVAEQHFQSALKIAQDLRDGGRSERQVIAWHHLSVLAAKRGQKEEAVRCAGHALQAMPAVRCTNTGNFNRVFAHIADVLEQNGEYDDAVQFRQLEVKTIPAQTVKDANAVTGSLIKLARALKNADRPAEAVTAYESVCKLQQSSNVAHARMEMASMLRKLGKNDEAEQQHKQSIEMFRKSEGDQGVNVAIALSNCGIFYAEMQRFEEALTVYQQSLDIRRKLYGETSARYALTQNNLANCLRQAGRLDEAASHAQSSISILRAENHRALPNALDTMGLTLRDGGRIAEAQTYVAESCALLKAKPNRDSQDYQKFSGHHADILESLERYAEADAARSEAQMVNEERKANRSLAEILDPMLVSVKLTGT